MYQTITPRKPFLRIGAINPGWHLYTFFTPHETTLWKNVANKYIQSTRPQTLLKLQTPSATIRPTIKLVIISLLLC